MARTKSIIKIPFLQLKVNKKTTFNIFGFLIAGVAFLLLISFGKNFFGANEKQLIFRLNHLLTEMFGVLAIFIPIILLLISGHFFNTKKFKIVKLNSTIGLLLVLFALLGVFKSGLVGGLIFDNLTSSLSLLGGIVILTVLFFIGLILSLDTSIDVFILFLVSLFKAVTNFVKSYFFRSVTQENKKERLKTLTAQEFISEQTDTNKQKSFKEVKISQTGNISSQLMIKPLAPTSKTTWVYPPLSLLADIVQKEADRGDVNQNAEIIERTLESFGIRARVVETNYGPAVTQYAIEITRGTKLSRITALANDLALALAAPTGQVRIEAPIPGRSLVGIEIPNRKPEIVTLKGLLSSKLFSEDLDPLLVPLGLDVSGQPQAASIGKMPHVLIAGATGSGKSVLLNAWICTFLFRTKPEDLRLILVDPKRVELTLYNQIPHLLTEVIVESEKIIKALRWTVKEMEERYKEFAKVGVRNLEGYNTLETIKKKPYILFIIDELADLMTFAPGDAEDLITRIAQMARATGIHLILATQRPSVDVITGLMKANIPTRVAFNVSSMIDSRVIIDMPGAEKLLGKGDMLFLPPDQAKPKRIQGPFITEKEVTQLVKFLRAQVPQVQYTEEITNQEGIFTSRGGTYVVEDGQRDPLYQEVLKLIAPLKYASASLLQRKFKIGYSRAARILDQLENDGYVGPAEASKPREVIKVPTTSSTTED